MKKVILSLLVLASALLMACDIINPPVPTITPVPVTPVKEKPETQIVQPVPTPISVSRGQYVELGTTAKVHIGDKTKILDNRMYVGKTQEFPVYIKNSGNIGFPFVVELELSDNPIDMVTENISITNELATQRMLDWVSIKENRTGWIDVGETKIVICEISIPSDAKNIPERWTFNVHPFPVTSEKMQFTSATRVFVWMR